jgi:hypothetical protein
MMRPRLVPRLAAPLWVVLFGARAWSAEPASGQAADAETPHLNNSWAHREQIPPPTDGEIEAPALPRHTAIYYVFGLGTPEGLSGFEVVHRFGESLELAAGMGAGLSAAMAKAYPLQWSVMPRLRLGDDHTALTLGAGLSGGQYTTDICPACDGPPTTVPTYYTIWTNFEVGVEHWSRAGFAVRWYLGFAHGTMLDGPSGETSGLDLPYLGVGVGYAF